MYPPVGDAAQKTLEIVNALRSGTRTLIAEEVPKLLVPDTNKKEWADAFMTINGMLVVRDVVRKILQRLDPEVHQFFPLTFQTKRGLQIEGPWFVLNITAKQDSVLIAASKVRINPNFPDTLCTFLANPKSEDIVVDPSRQSGVNLWREERFSFYSQLFCSDAVIDEMEERGLRFFKSYVKATNSDTLHSAF